MFYQDQAWRIAVLLRNEREMENSVHIFGFSHIKTLYVKSQKVLSTKNLFAHKNFLFLCAKKQEA